MATPNDTKVEADKPSEVKDGKPDSSESLVSEALELLSDIKKAVVRDTDSAKSKGGTAEFGKLELTGLGERGESKIGDPQKDQAQKKPETAAVNPEQVAKQLQSQAEADIREAHKDHKVTTDGSPPKAFSPQENFKLDTAKTPLEIAKEQLGPHATKEQISDYTTAIMVQNDLTSKRKEPLPPGTYKLPGQAADGSVYFTKDGQTTRTWNDGAMVMTSADGSGSVEYQKNGAQVYYNWNPKDAENSFKQVTKGDVQTETRGDGKITENRKIGEEWQRTKETVTKDGATKTKEYSGDNVTRETITQADKYTIVHDYDKKENIAKTTIKEPDGHKIELTQDPESKAWSGKRTDQSGKVVETVALLEGKLVFTDTKTTEQRAESYEPPTKEHTDYKIEKLGSYDANTGTISSQAGPVTLESSFAKGRTDMVMPNGQEIGTTITGEFSMQDPKTGEAVIMNPDGTGAHLNGDGTIDTWGPKPADNVKGEKLSPVEQDYLKKHPETDRREFVEIHRRFHGDQPKIDKFYESLNKLDTAKNLSNAEKAALRHDLMHHVAKPHEIYQGVTPSCNVTVVERDIAMTNPAKYVDTVVTAVSEGTITTADSKEPIKLDVKNLKMADSSGRDLASRIFQTAALHAEFHPAKNYVNTPDGVGRINPGDKDPKGTKPVVFDGLVPTEIADVRYKLTGEEKSITYVQTAEALTKAIELSGGVPITVLVDGASPPFDGHDTGDKPNHIVTITGIEQGPPVKYLVANQWGLESDHTSPARAIPADVLIKNMNQFQYQGGPVYTDNGGQLLAKIPNGDHNKEYSVYKAPDGSFHTVYEQNASEKHEKGNRSKHPEKFAPPPKPNK